MALVSKRVLDDQLYDGAVLERPPLVHAPPPPAGPPPVTIPVEVVGLSADQTIAYIILPTAYYEGRALEAPMRVEPLQGQILHVQQPVPSNLLQQQQSCLSATPPSEGSGHSASLMPFTFRSKAFIATRRKHTLPHVCFKPGPQGALRFGHRRNRPEPAVLQLIHSMGMATTLFNPNINNLRIRDLSWNNVLIDCGGERDVGFC
ncbi:hypothetical protein PRIPAC_73673 [Pristionchus pacificus]|nr:hypothetical protein PRIPAC_73673 [Pristionchus pacificus]